MEVNRTAGTQQGEGRCIIATKGGDFLYARWTCTGKPGEGCAGPFTITGGTGKFSKAMGESQFCDPQQCHGGGDHGAGTRRDGELHRPAVWDALKYTRPKACRADLADRAGRHALAVVVTSAAGVSRRRGRPQPLLWPSTEVEPSRPSSSRTGRSR